MNNLPGFLGTHASLLSDITLVAYVAVLLPAMLLGFYFARTHRYSPQHKLTMTAVVLLNWVFIGALMLSSYAGGVLPFLGKAQQVGDPRIALPTLHAITGGLAQILATYLMLRMWLEKILPRWLMVRRIKVYMRAALVLWLLTIFLGVLTYVTWYIVPPGGSQSQSVVPALTPEPGSTPELSPATTPEASVFGINPAATSEIIPAVTPEAGFFGINQSQSEDDSGQGRGRGRGRGGDD